MNNSSFVHLHNHTSGCLHPDTIIYNALSHHRRGETYRNNYTRLNKCKTIKELYDILTNEKNKGGTTKYSIKVFDGDVFVPSRIKAISKTENLIQFYELMTEDGKKIKASGDHRFLTLNGWKRLNELKIGDLMSCNGIPIYQSREWLEKKYLVDGLNQQQIADEIGVGRHVIKFWIKIFNLHKTKNEWMKNHLVKPETTEKIIQAKVNNRENLEIPKTKNASRRRARKWNDYLYKNGCFFCGEQNTEIEIHHIDRNPFNNNPTNLVPVCSSCHRKQHTIMPYTVQFEKLISIKVAEIDYAYDIEVKHQAKNFVANGFVVHNSLLDGMCKITTLVAKAKEYGYKFLSIADHSNIDLSIKFQKECLANNITPIIGCEVYITKDLIVKEKGVKSYHCLLIVKNETGWHNLLKMLTIANIQGFYYKPRLDYNTLLQHNEGLIISTACSRSFLLEDAGTECFLKIAKERDYEDVYLEIMPHLFQEQTYINDLCYSLHKKYDIPLIATNDCFVGETIINTYNGIKFIRDAVVGDLVLTHKGQYREILYINKRNVNESENIVNVKSTLGTNVLTTTLNHPIYCCKYDSSLKKMYNYSFKEVKNLDTSDYLLIPKIKNKDIFSFDIDNNFFKQLDILSIYTPEKVKEKTLFLNEIEYMRTMKSNGTIKIPRFLKLDKDFLKVLGFFIANGHVDKRQVSISFHSRKKYNYDLSKSFFESFGIKVCTRQTDNYIAVYFTSVVFAKVFSILCGNGAENKKFPFLNKELTLDEFLFILEGYIDCDGCCAKNILHVCHSTSRILAYQICSVLNVCGILAFPQIRNHSKVRHRNVNANPSSWNPLYCVSISGNNAKRMSEMMSLEKIYTLEGRVKKLKRYIENDSFFGVKFKKFEITNIDEELYNFEVEKDNSYTANGIAVHNCHYVNKEDSESHEVLLAIQTKTNMKDPKRWKFNSNEYYFKTADEMIFSFEKQNQFEKSVYLQAMKNTLYLAKSCDFRIPKHEMSLPQVPGLENIDEDKYLRQLVIDGYYKRINDCIVDPIYEQRFEHELDIISRKGFTRYFLIVHDLVNWARKNNIFPSPGRGSVGGSLIAFLIHITNVDPIKYNLPFSRFINEERVDTPDVDLDFPDNRREDVINYLKSTYGENNVANIATFLTLKSRGIVRDVARVFDIPLKEVDEFSKTIEEDIETALKEKTGEVFKKKYPEVVRHALVLEGIEKSKGKHAAGIVLCNEDLRNGNRCNLEYRDKLLTINWDLKDCEYNGLLKLDILGLNCLSILAETKELIKENVDFENLNLDDEKVFEELSKGNTTGVFQFGTKPMTALSKEMGIENFKHMYHAVALVRPGSFDSGTTSEYIERKHGKEWERKHPIYEEVTGDGYSLYFMQEDIINIVHKVAGLPYPIADAIRRVIGKKRDASEFDKYKDMFIQGCLNQKTFSKQEAEKFWEDLQYSANYIFCKAHALAYSMLGYYTAWAKFHYPSEFIAASLTMGSDTHKPELVKEARRLGLDIIPPKIGLSDPFKWLCIENKLHIPFNEIKGFGEKTLNKLQLPKYENGFYSNPEVKIEIKGKPKKILEEINAFDANAELPLEAYKYFDFDLSEGGYDKLLKLLNITKEELDIDKGLRGELEGLKLIKKRKIPETVPWENLENCKDCELRCEDCKPVYPSLSRFNIMIIGECPGKDEIKSGRGFVGKAGKRLWEELDRYDLDRYFFHISNTCKCWNREVGTPKESHIESCRKWLDLEIEFVKPFMILVLGNVALYRMRGLKGGINRLSGTTEWNDKYGAFLHYCCHPSAAIRNEENNELFKIGIRNFVDKLEKLGGI